MRVRLFRYRSRVCAVVLALSVGCGDSGNPTGTGAGGVNLRIETLYLVQSTQTRDGAVPLVADKDAYLRVFVLANGANTLTPSVRIRLSRNGTVQQTLTIPAPGSSVPTSVDQSSLAKSWNVKIPAATIQPGLQILADVDPTNAVTESNEQDNTFPTSGAAQTLQISALQPFRIRFVPMVQEENGKTGHITSANIEDYLTFTRKIHPVSSIDADLRQPYTVRGLGFDPQGNTWQAAVSELDAVRVSEGSNRFYYGVVNTDYNGGGVVGIAAGIPAGAALGWDRFPDAPITVAHEIGHDWGRRHAPCGGAGGPDPAYPYPLGMIGVYGFDIETQEVKIPSANTDIMGYCDARFWISDYTYAGIFNYRVSHPSATIAPVPSLVVWGRIENGVPILEPGFEATTVPALPSSEGPYSIEGKDGAGKTVFSMRFSAEQMPDVAGDVRHFAFAIPFSPEESGRVATLRLATRGRESMVRASAKAARQVSANEAGLPTTTASVAKLGKDRVSIQWNRDAYPLVIVRDATSGAILSLARGGVANVATTGGDVQLIFSDGIHSVQSMSGGQMVSLRGSNKPQFYQAPR